MPKNNVLFVHYYLLDIISRKFLTEILTYFSDVYLSNLEHNLSDTISDIYPSYIENFRLILQVFFGPNRTYFGLNKLKKHVLQFKQFPYKRRPLASFLCDFLFLFSILLFYRLFLLYLLIIVSFSSKLYYINRA